MSDAVVLVTDRRLVPQRAGNIVRIVALVGGLRAMGYRVVLVAPRIEGRLSPVLPALRRTLATRRLVDRFLAVDAAPFREGPISYDCGPFLPAVARAVRRHDPVAVIAEYCWMAPCLDAVTNGALKVIDTLDLMSVRGALYGEGSAGAWVHCTRDEEVSLLGRADVIMAIQRHEQARFQAMLPDARVIHVPHACWPMLASSAGGAPVVGFVGSGNHSNVDGIRAFLAEGWPVVRGACPEAELRIYGGIVHALDGATPPQGVRLPGLTRRLEEAYGGARVMINPVTLGTGLKVKSVEALAFGKALVTTSCGAAGLEAGAGTAFLMEDEMPAFGRAVAGLLADDAARATLERAARDFAEPRFGPRAAFAELVDALEAHARS